MKVGRFRAARVAVLVGCAAVPGMGCSTGAKFPTGTHNSGSVALSPDFSRVYVADADNNQLLIIDPSARSVIARVAVGQEPSHVVTGSDGRIYVSNRQSRSVSVVDPSTWKELSRIAVGTEPTGMAFTQDGQTLVVANTTNDTVSIIDVKSLQVTGTITTDADPYGVGVMTDGMVVVTHLRPGSVSVLDLASKSVTRTFPLSVSSHVTGDDRLPGEAVQPVISNGKLAYFPHQQALADTIATTPTQEAQQPQAGSSYSAVASNGTLPTTVVTPALATVDMIAGTLLLPLQPPGPVANLPPPPMTPFTAAPQGLPTKVDGSIPPFLLTVSRQALSGPVAAVIDPNGEFLYVVHKNSNNVAIISATQGSGSTTPTGQAALGPGLVRLVSVGAGPDGIAVPEPADRAYVYNSFDHSLSIIGGTTKAGAPREIDRFAVSSTPLTPEQDLGRRLFFSATDARMTSDLAGGIACASCHPGGREDGHTWHFTEGPRNTPNLAGRHLTTTAPYHWDGQITDMPAFNTVIVNRMGGSGELGGGTGAPPLADNDLNAVRAFLDSQSPPDNPYPGSLDPSQVQAGQALFEDPSVGCSSCHAGPDLTDNSFHDVGSMQNVAGDGATNESKFFVNSLGQIVGPNTPSLHSIFASAPYLHDGSKADLLARVSDDAGGLHGHTSQLSDDQKASLVAFLETL